MRIRAGAHVYDWVDNWARPPDAQRGMIGWAHHSVVVTEAGLVMLFHQADTAVQVFDREGNFKRAFGQDFLAGSSAFIAYGDMLIVVELRARLALLDSRDRPAGYLGAYQKSQEIKGWPNIPVEHVKPGKFVAPHGLASDTDGNLYVVEWIIGGRVAKLVKV